MLPTTLSSDFAGIERMDFSFRKCIVDSFGQIKLNSYLFLITEGPPTLAIRRFVSVIVTLEALLLNE